jgi:hypothetical protein
MAMTFLQLFQRTHQESGTSGAQPTAVTSQSGKLLRIVDWVSQAWVDIQRERPNWSFMWESFTFDTIADQRDYIAASLAEALTDVKHWDTESFLIYKDSLDTNDQNELEYMPYARWRTSYRNQMAARPSARPQLFTILPNNTLRFEPVPDVVYNIAGEYSRTPQLFTADADVPTDLPDDFHMLIVWQALKYYGFFEDAPDVLDMAETNFENLLVKLEDTQLPAFDEDFQALA